MLYGGYAVTEFLSLIDKAINSPEPYFPDTATGIVQIVHLQHVRSININISCLHPVLFLFCKHFSFILR